nr:ABC transporter permease [uncultured Pedobacter sp.]
MQNKEWTIESDHNLFDLQLKEIVSYKHLLFQLINRDVLALYKQTILGPIWFFIQPILTTVVFTFVFGKLVGVSTDGLPQPLFYLAGIINWNYFSECLNKTSTVFKDNVQIFGKVYFPRIIVPISTSISVLSRYAIQLLVFLTCLFIYHYKGSQFHITLIIFAFPLMVIVMAALGLGLGIIISALTTKYKDLAFLVAFGLQLLMYTTTVIYPLSAASGNLKWLIQLNPMTSVIEVFRYGFLGKGDFTISSIAYSLIISALILFTGVIAFNKVERTFIDTI